jgi:hypothetical protein
MFLPARLAAIRSPLEIWSAEMTLKWIPSFSETSSTKAAQRSSWPVGWKAHVARFR